MTPGLEDFARHLTSSQGPDWLKLLQSYRWHGADWLSSVRSRLQFHEQVEALVNRKGKSKAVPSAWPQLVNEIVHDWGGLPLVQPPDLQMLWQSVKELLADADDRGPMHFGHIATAATQVYHMAEPKRFAIYDVNVARALQQLISQAFPEPRSEPMTLWHLHGRFEDLTVPEPQPDDDIAPRGGMCIGWSSDLNKLPSLRDQPRKFLNAFFMASELCRAIAGILRHEHSQQPGGVQGPDGKLGDPRWQLYHIEMALFMLGKGVLA